ncbi:flagellar protein FlbD [Cryobacterium sp. LW097]|uniref:flagellar FlbD family protein n=1 Tax=unclassified Cryobacterium TaxID=2649013 RepID=UPI000B4D5F52|nr:MULTISPECIES: flagellar FlbD family protein [unclassified Cryobacterium]ASD21936.1 flagellar protein FlbD [Cryobacterium sp. LW097]TFC53487.1 flagellar protein FlbD [Cryobacterium sp. TMB3-1-2]TFC69154.1 flagellar protein FlbD [Cryobacterium sp. TMB3-15]TFC76048.1 flagellar protein FlbD [Cryobacterium sp. TMB3-10]TFC87026.1 flagellar protein FlbD [Cryobacterium sp. TMT4-31]
MIVVTRLNDSQFAINPDLIERIHVNPDTTLVMVDGAKFIVTESLAEVIEKIAAYRAHVIGLAYSSGDGSVVDPDTRPDAVVPLRPRRI